MLRKADKPQRSADSHTSWTAHTASRSEHVSLAPTATATQSGPLDHSVEDIALLPPADAPARGTLLIQPKMTIRPPGDRYENEADRVARQFVDSEPEPATAAPVGEPFAERDAMQKVESKTRPGAAATRSSTGVGLTASHEVESGIEQARTGGHPLPEHVQRPLEDRLGVDFSRVRIHTDTRSDELNRSLRARAFTTKQDVFFRRGFYNPASRGGLQLIAHEMTHVVQQDRSLQSRTASRSRPRAPKRDADSSRAAHQEQPTTEAETEPTLADAPEPLQIRQSGALVGLNAAPIQRKLLVYDGKEATPAPLGYNELTVEKHDLKKKSREIDDQTMQAYKDLVAGVPDLLNTTLSARQVSALARS